MEPRGQSLDDLIESRAVIDTVREDLGRKRGDRPLPTRTINQWGVLRQGSPPIAWQRREQRILGSGLVCQQSPDGGSTVTDQHFDRLVILLPTVAELIYVDDVGRSAAWARPLEREPI